MLHLQTTELQENDQCKRDNDDDVDADDDDSSDDSNGDDGNEDGTALSITSLSDRFRRLLSSGSIDEEEKEIVSKVRGLNIGAAARHTIGVIQMTTSTCQPGFYCERTDFRNGRCTPVNESGLYTFLSISCMNMSHIHTIRTLIKNRSMLLEKNSCCRESKRL